MYGIIFKMRAQENGGSLMYPGPALGWIMFKGTSRCRLTVEKRDREWREERRGGEGEKYPRWGCKALGPWGGSKWLIYHLAA